EAREPPRSEPADRLRRLLARLELAARRTRDLVAGLEQPATCGGAALAFAGLEELGLHGRLLIDPGLELGRFGLSLAVRFREKRAQLAVARPLRFRRGRP